MEGYAPSVKQHEKLGTVYPFRILGRIVRDVHVEGVGQRRVAWRAVWITNLFRSRWVMCVCKLTLRFSMALITADKD